MHRCLLQFPPVKEVGLWLCYCDISSTLDRAESMQKCSSLHCRISSGKKCKKGEKYIKVVCKFFFPSDMIWGLKSEVYIICYSAETNIYISNLPVRFLHSMELIKFASRSIIPNEVRQRWPIILNLSAFIYWLPLRFHVVILEFKVPVTLCSYLRATPSNLRVIYFNWNKFNHISFPSVINSMYYIVKLT